MAQNISSFRSLSFPFKFTRLKLFLTIAIVLFGIFLIVIGSTIKSPDRDQTRIILQMIRLKIEDYAAEHDGNYPVGEDGNSAVLYRVLSGDESGQGNPPTGPVYWPELNNPNNSALVGTLNGKKVILDGFGNTIRYRSALDKNGNRVAGMREGEDFALWSVGPDGEPSDLSPPGNFKSKETEDDIWE